MSSQDNFWRLELEGISLEELPTLPQRLKSLNTWSLETGRLILELKGPEQEVRDYWHTLSQENRIHFQRIERPGRLKILKHSRLELCWGTNGPAETVLLDPEGAFGSGKHPTTALILDLLDELWAQNIVPRRILDIGTGSGILALTAARLWGRPVWAVEIDPQAVLAAQRNVYANHLEKKIHLICGTIDSLKGHFDLILANIYLRVLLQEAETIKKLLAPGGNLLTTGFLSGSEAPLLKKYATLSLVDRRRQEKWLALWWQKR